jgi:hypothetical protein
VQHRDPSCLEAAWFLATPPFALGALSLLAGAGLAAAAGAWSITAILAAGLSALALTIVTGLIQARAGARTWLALLAAPWYVAFKAVVQIRALVSLLRRDRVYGPTARV